MLRLKYKQRDTGLSFALAVGVMIVASLVLSLIFGTEATGWKFWLMQGLYTAALGSTAFVYAAISKTNFIVASKIKKAPPYAHFLWGCGAVAFLIACMTPVNNWLMTAIEKMGFNRPSVDLEDNIVGLIIVACLLPCFTEEMLFRGTIAQGHAESHNLLAAIALNGALFALFHANPAQTVHQFVLGAFMTLLVYRSGSLWTSIIVHFFNNAAVVVLSYTPIGADEFWTKWQYVLFAVGLVGFSLCVFGYLKTTKSVRDISDSDLEQNNTASTEGGNTMQSNMALIVAIVVCALLWIMNLFS